MTIESIDYQTCSACLRCYQICPMDVIRTAGREVYIAFRNDCMCCYLCEVECPTGSIHVEPRRGKEKPKPW